MLLIDFSSPIANVIKIYFILSPFFRRKNLFWEHAYANSADHIFLPQNATFVKGRYYLLAEIFMQNNMKK